MRSAIALASQAAWAVRTKLRHRAYRLWKRNHRAALTAFPGQSARQPRPMVFGFEYILGI
jgi:hypothetical protein